MRVWRSWKEPNAMEIARLHSWNVSADEAVAIQQRLRALAERETSFPYVPGLLSFREAPAVLDAMEKLSTRPDLLMFDGQGIAHPRRLGIAAHMGVYLGMPSI